MRGQNCSGCSLSSRRSAKILPKELRELVNRQKESNAHRSEVQQNENDHQDALKSRDKLIVELEKLCAKLQEENSHLKRGYKPPMVEDYVSEEEKRPAKRARVD
jgi:hypothetical protein